MTSDVERLHNAIRSLSVLVSFGIMADCISPAMWVLKESASVLYKVASLSSSSQAIAVCLLVSAALILPFVIMQLFYPDCHQRRQIIKIATYGMILGASIWGLMAFLSRNLDYKFALWNFVFNGLVALTMAAIMANSLNDDQKEIMRDSQRADL